MRQAVSFLQPEIIRQENPHQPADGGPEETVSGAEAQQRQGRCGRGERRRHNVADNAETRRLEQPAENS